MAKKTWIKVRRGILDPKHINALGNAWYLFFYILDQADWETGKIYDWKDKFAADDLEKPLSLIRLHRQQLEKEGYISCDKGQHSQTLSVNRWKDPRKDEFECSQSEENNILSESESTVKDILCDSNGIPELSQSRARVEPELSQSFNADSNNLHSSSNHISHLTYNMLKDNADKSAKPEPHYEPCDDDGLEIQKKKPKRKSVSDTRSKTPAIISFRRITGKYPQKAIYDRIIEVMGEQPDELKAKRCYQEWCERGYNPNSAKWLTDWYVNGVQSNGSKSAGKPTGTDAVKEELARLEAERG